MRKVFIEIKSRLVIYMDDGVEVNDVLEEMEFSLPEHVTNAGIVEHEIVSHEVIDSNNI